MVIQWIKDQVNKVLASEVGPLVGPVVIIVTGAAIADPPRTGPLSLVTNLVKNIL